VDVRLKARLRLAAAGAGTWVCGAILGGIPGFLLVAVFIASLIVSARFLAPPFILGELRALKTDPISHPDLHRMATWMASRTGIACPGIHVSEDLVPWACVMLEPRSGPVLVVSHGFFSALEPEEREAVLAHEFAHIKHGDLGLTGGLAWLAGAPERLFRTLLPPSFRKRHGRSRRRRRSSPWMMPAALVLAAVPSLLVQLVLDREIDLEADRAAAEICGNPMALASALATLEEAIAHMPPTPGLHGLLHLFTVDPSAIRSQVRDLFRVWASTEERIGRLQEIAGSSYDPVP